MKFLNIITKDKLNDPLSTLQHFGCSWNEKEIEQKMRKKPKKKKQQQQQKKGKDCNIPKCHALEYVPSCHRHVFGKYKRTDGC
jgi:hypothetical protein